jgi:hypothetical protein
MPHFSELLLSILLLLSLGFLGWTSHVHNDALTQWGQGIVGQVLAALLTLMVASRPTPKPPDPPAQ